MGTKPPGLNLGLKEDEIVQLISLVDADRDGVITLKEFITSRQSLPSRRFCRWIKRMERDGRNRKNSIEKGIASLAKLYETTINDEMKAYQEGANKAYPKRRCKQGAGYASCS